MALRIMLTALFALFWIGMAQAGVVKTTGTYGSGGKMIAYECFAPSAPGKHPLIVLVHGSDGLQIPPIKAFYETYAQGLAREGYVVFFPHYFDRTATKFPGVREIFLNFLAWQSAIADGVTFAVRRPDGRSGPIGLLGFSLGASEALSLASQDKRIGVVVEYFGAMPPFAAALMKKMPPTLILHGDKDPLVPVSKAHTLEALLKSKQVPYEIKIYPNQGHGFIGVDAEDARRRVISFLDRYLEVSAFETKPSRSRW